MISSLSLNKAIALWQHFIQRATKRSSLSPIVPQISRLKKELDRSFPEFGDIEETIATYNLYRRLETLQQQINSIEE